jgi:3-oxoacyl-[acyl-carrier-protein] synthase III
VLGTDGRGANQIIVKAGGLRCRPTAETAIEKEDSSGNWRSDQNLFMDGADVFSFALRTVPPTLQKLLEKANLTIDQIDFMIPHQANKFVLERTARQTEVPSRKVLDRYGEFRQHRLFDDSDRFGGRPQSGPGEKRRPRRTGRVWCRLFLGRNID